MKVVHPDYALLVTLGVAVGAEGGGEPLRLTLERGGTVRGRVFDTEGSPEANVTLQFQDKNAYARSRDEAALATAVTDADGFYEVQHLPGHLCSVSRVHRSQILGTEKQTILVENGKTRTLDFGGDKNLTGRLLLNGVPLSDTDLILSDDSPHFGIFRAHAQTQSDGSFSFRGVPAGERTLYYAIPGRRVEWGQLKTIEVTPAGVELGTIDHLTGRLDVRIEPASVAEVQQIRVSLQTYNPIWDFGYATGVIKHNREERAFSIDQIPFGKYELIMFHPKYLSLRRFVEVTPETRQQSLTLEVPNGTASLSGRIDKEIGGTDYYTVLRLWSSDGSLQGYLTPDQKDGSYRIDNLPAGDYLIREAHTRDAHVIQKVTLQASEQRTLNFTPNSIDPDPVIHGFLQIYPYTSDGIPLPCNPFLDGADGRITPSSSQDGRITFRGKPGTYTLMIEYPGFETLRRQVELKPTSKDDSSIGDRSLNVFLKKSN